MRRFAAFLCLAAWALAAVAQLAVMLQTPDKVVAFGVDVTHASHALLIRQLLLIAAGLGVAVMACVIPRFRLSLLVIASLLYLLPWIPWRLLLTLGPASVVKTLYLFASTPELQLLSIIRDFVLPITFLATILLGCFERGARRLGGN